VLLREDTRRALSITSIAMVIVDNLDGMKGRMPFLGIVSRFYLKVFCKRF
jgi:hypothetical protein